MQSLLKRTWTVVRTILITMLVLLVVWVVFNLFDRAPTPAAQKLAMQVEPSLKPQENAYIYQLGLDAPADADVIQWGLSAQNGKDSSNGGSPLPLESVDLSKRDLQIILARYETLLSILRYQDAEGETLPNLYKMVRASKLYQSQLIAGRDQNPEAALDGILKEIKWQQSVLAQTNTLVSKMVVRERLNTAYFLLADFIAALPESMLLTKQAPILQTLSPEPHTWHMDRVMGGEHRLTTQTLEESKTAGGRETTSWLEKWTIKCAYAILFKPQDTANQFAAFHQTITDFSHLSAKDWHAQRIEKKHALNVEYGLNWNWLYNPIGRILAGVASPQYNDYVDRLFDTYSLNRMVGAALLLRLQKPIPVEWFNPYTEQAFTFDPNIREISFQPIDPEQSGKSWKIPI